MDSNGLRRAFIDFFVERGHTEVASSGLIPHHPRAPLFTNAGMNQFIPYFLGEERPPYPRAATAQKCVRIRGKHDDIELIGRTTRHFTFFEMLGNFSFGDYFKAEAIRWSWEFLTETLKLDGDRIWATVHTDDDTAAEIWIDDVGLPAKRIQRTGEDNFWEMGDTGPCGPDSEVFFDRGPRYGAGGGPVGGGEERFVEVWNMVFPQYDRQPDRSLEDLPKPGIDTGMGLERLAAIVQGVPSVWDTDILRRMIATAEQATGKRYGRDEEADVALRILADHSRSMTFLVSDGVFPSNEDRGYVLRRLIRRAVRQAYQLNADRKLVTPDLVAGVVEVMKDGYPELVNNQEFVTGIVAKEEEQFRSTMRSGLRLLDEALSGKDCKEVSGQVAFRLHDTHGFPIELTREVAAERGVGVDEEGFAAEMEQQRQRARAARSGGAESSDAGTAYKDLLEQFGTTRFVGYEMEAANGRVLAVLPHESGKNTDEGGKKSAAKAKGAGEQVEIVLDSTPFYAEGGGQIGDTGTITTSTGKAVVTDTNSALPGLTRHIARIVEGTIDPGQEAEAVVDSERRSAVRRNHTGTHLLHWALRHVLGGHVRQQGSLVAPDRLRFDFTHYGPLTPEQKAEVEDLVNERVLTDEAVTIAQMSKSEADEAGAIAFFDEKYGDRVRVVRAGSDSTELCGGTHVARLGQIGPFEITSEASIGSNIRRVEATTGTATLEHLRSVEGMVDTAAGLLKASPEELPKAIERKLAELRTAETRLKEAEVAALAGVATQLAEQAVTDGGRVVARRDGLPADRLRELAQQVGRHPGVGTVVLGGSPDDGKVSLVAVVAKGGKPDAPSLIGPAARIVGGGGGGKKPELAMAGGRDVTRLDEALDHVRSALGLAGK